MIMTKQNYPHPDKYVEAWKRVKQLDDDVMVRVDWGTFQPARIVKADFYKALLNRINSRGGIVERGRKFSQIYQASLYRDCQNVRAILTMHLRVYQFETKEVRQRFSHLLAHYDD